MLEDDLGAHGNGIAGMREMPENDEDEKRRLWHQLREACGRVIYTYETLNVREARIESQVCWLKVGQILLSAASSVSLLSAVLQLFNCNQKTLLAVTTVLSFASLAVNFFFKEFQLADEVLRCKQSIHDLWHIREKYYSLLTDIDDLTTIVIKARRDRLQQEEYNIYQQAPRTTEKDYAKASKNLKVDHEQTFSEEELDDLLPVWTRRKE